MKSADGELVRLAQTGDEAAYAELVRRHQATAFRVAFLITRSAHDAEEVTQDGFVKAWNALDRFRSDDPFRPWLLRIVKNEALNRVRSRGRRRRLELQVAAESPHEFDSAESWAVRSSEHRRLLEAIHLLPEGQRLVVIAVHLMELSESEAAEMLGIRRGTVKSRSARARARLAEVLGEEVQ